MKAEIVVGGAFGDEGKGKIIAYLAVKDNANITARGGVGPNAGHTVIENNRIHKVRLIPSAFVNTSSRLLIGSGVLVNPDVFFNEVSRLHIEGRVGIDSQCAIIEGKHLIQDKEGHLRDKIGTTGTGTGPANSDRVLRLAKLAKEVPSLKEFVTDVSLEVNKALEDDKKVLIEGTQGTFLSLYHGTYPFVTSKDVTAAAVCADIGIGPTKIGEVTMVLKGFFTRVGEGPLENELSVEESNKRGWNEIGTVTGRSRRSAPFNMDLAIRACMLNGATQIALTKLDVIFKESAGLKNFEELPNDAKRFIQEIEDKTHVPVTLIGTGASIEEIIDRRDV